MGTSKSGLAYLGVVMAAGAFTQMAAPQDDNLIANGSFETIRAVTADAEGLVSGWTIGGPAEVPTGSTRRG